MGRWEERLVLFVGYLINDNKKSTTIKSYISAIKAVLQYGKVKLKLDELLLTSLTRACKLNNDRMITRLPIKLNVLNILIKTTEKLYTDNSQPYLVTLYKAMLSTAYFGLFRISEITAGPHAVQARDVHIGVNKNKMMFLLRTSKTHNPGDKPQIIKISAERESSTPNWCPFKLLKDFLRIRGKRINETEEFFIFRDHTPVKPDCFRKILKKLLKVNGFENRLYSSHSLRAGRACQLFEMGISVETILKIGRFKSSSIYAYLCA